VASTATEWPEGATGSLVCSFAMSGTNACVLLERPTETKVAAQDEGPHVLPLSASTEEELRVVARRLRDTLDGGCSLPEVAATLSIGMRHGPRRMALVASDATHAASLLGTWLDGAERPGVYAPVETQMQLAFLATGQGAQYPGMGQQLYQSERAFREVLDACDACYADAYGRSLCDLMFGKAPDAASAVHQTRYAQPLLYAYECAMAALWQNWGITPDFLMGHSLGEIVAAHLAGVFSLEEGLRLCAERGALMQALPAGGAMLAAMTSETSARGWLAAVPGTLAIAAVNGPQSVVFSGEETAIAILETRLQAEGIRHRRLQVSHAFHSPLIEPALEVFRQVLAGISFHPPTIPVVSNLTGEISTDMATPDYWLAHARNPVRFADGMTALAHAGCGAFLEIGPADTLVSMGRRCLGPGYQWLPSTRKDMRPQDLLRQAQAALYACNHAIDWQAVYVGKPRRRAYLPGYPLPRAHHWMAPVETAPAVESAPVATNAPSQPGEESVRDVLRRLIREVSEGAVENITDDDGFFALGLDSLRWTQVHNRLQEYYKCEIPIALVFIYPTLGELSDYLDQEIKHR
ncbi:MAG TPA: acyltransferase domain-containing protein, partial [Armatimonadota bacterium]|nr:acyltransferase domain-containing protein [Armatimonadota bacterium]